MSLRFMTRGRFSGLTVLITPDGGGEPLRVSHDEPPVSRDHRVEDGRQVIGDAAPTFSYADLAVAVVDEATSPKHSRQLAAVAS